MINFIYRVPRDEAIPILRPVLPALWIVACKDSAVNLGPCMELVKVLAADIKGRIILYTHTF